MRYLNILLLLTLLVMVFAPVHADSDVPPNRSGIIKKERLSEELYIPNQDYSFDRTQCTGYWYGGYYQQFLHFLWPGDMFVVYQDPTITGCTDTYPFSISKIKFHIELSVVPVEMNFHALIFDVQDPSSACPTLGPAISANFETINFISYDTVIELIFPQPVCVDRPYFAGFEVVLNPDPGYPVVFPLDDDATPCICYHIGSSPPTPGIVDVTDYFLDWYGDALIWSEGINSEENQCQISNIKVSEVIPLRNQINVSTDANVSVVFDSSISSPTLNDTTFLIYASQTGLHTGTITYDGPTQTATFDPNEGFEPGEMITVILTDGIESTGGMPLKPYSWSFTVVSRVGSASFTIREDMHSGDGPNSIIALDYDLDGIMDMAVSNEGDANISLFKGTGNGSFNSAVTYSADFGTHRVISADLNMDEYPDLITANRDNLNISVFMNNGNGTFADQVNYGVGSGPHAVCPIDLENDGDYDLVAANAGDDDLTVYVNNGSGDFSYKNDYPTGSYPVFATSADFNNDGYMDIAVANENGNSISIHLNNSFGALYLNESYPIGNSPYDCRVADFNADGYIDISTANPINASSTILMNNGDGTFYKKADIPVISDPWGITNADIDTDGDVDCITANALMGGIWIWQNDGAGNFSPLDFYGVGDHPNGIMTADLDGDGDLDIATVNRDSDNITILFNDHVYTDGDNCDYPYIIKTSTDLPFESLNETTCGRLNEYYNTCIGDYDQNEDIIYEIVLENQMALKITMDPLGSSYTGIALVIDCPPTGADYSDCIEESHNHTASNPHILTSPLLNPRSYFLIIDNHDLSGSSCIESFNLTIEEYIIPSGENCSSPIMINTSDLPFESYYETTCGTINNYFNTCMDDFDEGEDIIYEFIVDTAVTVDIIMDPLGTSNTAVGIADVCPFHDPEIEDCTFESKHFDATPHILNDIELFPGETYYLMIDSWGSGSCIPAFNLIIKPSGSPDMVEIRTDCIRIAWNSAGNIGIAGYNGYGGFNMAFMDDCDTTDNTQFSNDNASKYLYESSPFVLRVDESEDTLFGNYMFRDDWLSPRGFRSLGDPISDSITYSDYNYGTTGDFITQDSTVTIQVEYFAPKSSDSCEFIVLRETFVNISGDSLFGVYFGNLFDWDIPSDVGVRNGSGFIKGDGDTSLDLMYCYGAEYGPDENENDDCVLADQRLGGVSFYNGYRLSAGCPATDSIENPSVSWWTGSNSEWIGPLGGWDGSQLYQKMEALDSTWETYESLNPGSDYVDLNMVAAFGRYDLGISDSLVFIKIMVSTTAGLSGINSAVNKGTAWIENRPQIFTWPAFNDDECVSCCDLPGDASDNGAVNILDITFLIAYLYKGGPEPNCLYEGDADGNETINILDITRLIAFLYKGGPEPECQ